MPNIGPQFNDVWNPGLGTFRLTSFQHLTANLEYSEPGPT